MKTVYAINQTTGQFAGEVQLDDSDMSPLEPGVYLVPAGCVEIAPPAHSVSEYAEFVGGQWLVKTIPDPEPEPAPPPAPPVVVASISPRQIRQALTRAGLRAAVEAAVAAGDQDLKDWYEFSTAFERLNPQVMAMGEALSVSQASLDDLWALGASL